MHPGSVGTRGCNRLHRMWHPTVDAKSAAKQLEKSWEGSDLKLDSRCGECRAIARRLRCKSLTGHWLSRDLLSNAGRLQGVCTARTATKLQPKRQLDS